MRTARVRFLLIGCLSLLLLATACSGSRPDWYYGKSSRKIILTDTTTSGSNPGTGGTEPSATPGSSGAPSPGATGVGVPTVGSSNGTSGGNGNGNGAGTGTGTGTGGGKAPRYVANIYSGAADRIGITESTIRLCGHAALALGAAFDISEVDLNVYWEQVNAGGGIHGRGVSLDWIDDRYDGTAATQAVKDCVAQNPFFILGGIGFDQIPFAREEAEKNKTLYLHHMAIRKGLDRATYSFSTQPTVEEVGTAFGQYITKQYGSKRIGIISRNTEYFLPGRDTGLKVMRDNNVNVVENLEVIKNQGSYSLEINRLQNKTDVVWIWENALNAANIIKQAAQQNFHPKWVVFPFQTTLDLVGRADSVNPSIDGVGTWSAYTRGGYGSAFNQYGYGDEMKRFEAAYRKYRGANFVPNDILWQVWVGNKALHQMLTDCGRDCTRNRIAGMLLGGLKLRVNPNCEANFAHRNSLNGRVGLHQYFVLQTYAKSSQAAAWKTISWCRESLL